MPIYVYYCDGCKKEWERFNSVKDRKHGGDCEVCGRKGRIAITAIFNNTFKARWFEGIDAQPTYVTSEKQLSDICKKNDCYVEKDDRSKQRKYYEKRGMVEEGKRLYQ